MIIKKNLRNVNFKGLKLTLKNIVQFLSPPASGANWRDKYQHFGLNLFFKNSRSHNFVYKYENDFKFKGSKLTWKAKNPIFIQSSSNVNRNTIWKL